MRLDTSTDPQVGFRPPGPLDPSTALQTYDGPFGRRQAAHLSRRAGFGPTPQEVDALAGLGMQHAVDSFLHPSVPELDFPDVPDGMFDPKTRVSAPQNWWLDRMLRTRRPLVEKMTLFWHGHFATSYTKVPTYLMVAQINLFRSQALGNFRTLLLSVARDPAMLIWLDNRSNVAAHPNENFAREVMELFALGLGNYSEDDVKDAARAFTGWTVDTHGAAVYKENLHDAGIKTILGRTGPFGSEDVVNLIVAQPVHQRFICRKLLEYFVYSDPAQVYAISGYDLARTVGTVLRSNVFNSSRAYRALPKSPIEFTIGILRYLGVQQIPPDTVTWLRRMGQIPLAPPSVKGWDGGPAWINTATLLARFNFVSKVVSAAPRSDAQTAPPATAMAAAGAAPMLAGGAPPMAAATFATLTPDRIVAQTGGMDAGRIVQLLASGALQDDVTSNVRKTLLDYLNSAGAAAPAPLGPENYQDKIRGALSLVLQLPANQLN